MKRIILKLSGESLAGSQTSGIDPNSCLRIAKEIVKLHDLGYEIGIITGGGNFWRGRDAAKSHLDRVDADYMGMLGTIMNSVFMMNVLKTLNVDAITVSAIPMETIVPTYNSQQAQKDLAAGKVVFFAGGTGKPYCSTDTAAAMRAFEVEASMIFMAKNGVDGVYSADPKKDPAAKRYSKLSFETLIDQNLGVMDLTAAKICADHDIDILVFDINADNSIVNIITDFTIGTIITNKEE